MTHIGLYHTWCGDGAYALGFWGMHRHSEISPVASCLVHEEKLSPFDMFHKLKYIEQCKCCRQLHSMKRRQLALKRGGCNGGLDSEVYLFILDSCQLEAVVGSNELFISCHVLCDAAIHTCNWLA